MSTRACGFCDRAFTVAAAVTYRLAPAAGGYRWTVDGDEVATATWRDGTWDLYDLQGDRPALTLVPVDVDGATRVALVHHRSRLVATFAPTPGNGVGVVRDSHERILVLVRDDGPTGVHVIDSTGTVLALAGRTGDRGLDVLLLSDEGDPTPNALFVLAVTLLVELVHVGELRGAA